MMVCTYKIRTYNWEIACCNRMKRAADHCIGLQLHSEEVVAILGEGAECRQVQRSLLLQSVASERECNISNEYKVKSYTQ